ncbi:MAG: response regulator [Alphaproteobacteria bacterium]
MAKILIAEDDPAVREFVARALTHVGHHVTTVDDGTQALERMGADHFDLLITDVKMPGIDGITLSHRVARARPSVCILVMTGYAEEQQRAAVLNGTVRQIITKPFTLKQICAAANEALAARV